MKLDSNLKKLMKEQDLSMTMLSEKTGIAVQTIHNWLSGAEPRSLGKVKIMADFFHLSVDALCFDLKSSKNAIDRFDDEINAGIYEVVLRKIRK